MIDQSFLRVRPATAVETVAAESPSSFIDDPQPTEIPASHIQRLIAGRMLAAKRYKPCFYLETTADVTELMSMRHNLSRALGVKVTSQAFLIHVLATAARRYPLMVGRFLWHDPGNPEAGAVIRIADGINVGFAVNGPQGLVVPVIKNAQDKSLAAIAREEKLLTDKARSNKLTLEDLEDQTIGLSSLGAYDVDSFFAIAPPPVSTILAAGKISLAAVPLDGHVAVRKTMSLSLTVDQRAIHAQYAAGFLQSLAERLNDPEKLI